MTRVLGLVGLAALAVACGSDDADPGAAATGGSANSSGGSNGNSGGTNGNSGGTNGNSGGSNSVGGGAPMTCDDANSCTLDVGEGSADNLTCTHEEITACTDGDGCCPSACTPDDDSDCGDPSNSPIPDERRIEWKPGIPGGIPTLTTVCATVDAATYGNGTTDATSAIQGALDACPEGQVVLLPAGTYQISETLRIEKGVVLRGEGPGSTRIELAGTQGVLLRIGKTSNPSAVTAVTDGMNKGSTSITVADASQYAVGDVIQIDQKDDPALVTTGDCNWFKRSDGGARSLGQTFEVTGKDGNTLQSSSPLYYSYASAHSPEITKPSNGYVRRAAVEDVYLGRRQDPGAGTQGNIIQMVYTVESWVRNVETDKVAGRHIAIEASYRAVVRDSYVHHAWNYDPGANAYGITLSLDTSDSLIENNIVYFLNIPLALESSGGGNVIAYNYIDDAHIPDTGFQVADIGTHCSFPYMELFEGNYAPHIGPDNVHGGSGYMTFFRNYVTAHHATVPQDNNIVAFAIDANNLYYNIVGNVLLRPEVTEGAYELECNSSPASAYQLGYRLSSSDFCTRDDRVLETLFRHGNFDYFTDQIQYADGVEQDMPPSLYLTAKPDFFGDSPWPYVDPERDPMVATLPAMQRFQGQ